METFLTQIIFNWHPTAGWLHLRATSLFALTLKILKGTILRQHVCYLLVDPCVDFRYVLTCYIVLFCFLLLSLQGLSKFLESFPTAPCTGTFAFEKQIGYTLHTDFQLAFVFDIDFGGKKALLYVARVVCWEARFYVWLVPVCSSGIACCWKYRLILRSMCCLEIILKISTWCGFATFRLDVVFLFPFVVCCIRCVSMR